MFRLISLHCGIQKRKQVTVLDRNMSWKIQIKVQHSLSLFPFQLFSFLFPFNFGLTAMIKNFGKFKQVRTFCMLFQRQDPLYSRLVAFLRYTMLFSEFQISALISFLGVLPVSRHVLYRLMIYLQRMCYFF